MASQWPVYSPCCETGGSCPLHRDVQSRTQRNEECLLAEPLRHSLLAHGRLPPQASSPSDLSNTGRRAITEVFAILDELDKHRDRLLALRARTFDFKALRFLAGSSPPASRSTCQDLPRLDPNHKDNEAYIGHSICLEQIKSALDHIPCSNPHLLSSIEALRREIQADLLAHKSVLQHAVDNNLQGRERYKQLGGDAQYLATCESVRMRLRGFTYQNHEAKSSFQHLNSLALAIMLLAALLRTVLGLSISATKLVMKCVKIIVQLAFLLGTRHTLATSTSGSAEDPLRELLSHLSIDPRTASTRYNLYPGLTLYASCPRCSCIYPPLSKPNPTGFPYQERCSQRDLLGRACNARLVRARLVGDRKEWTAVCRFPFRDPTSFVADLFSRPQLEEAMDSMRADVREPCEDIWDAELLANFDGPDGLPFYHRQGHLAFALAIDWFNPYMNLESKKKWSIGAVYLICLNIPPESRYKIENVCLVAIIPGPKEPSLEGLNHFLLPIVESFIRLWSQGLWISSTHRFPYGRLVHGAIAIVIADLIGARHVAGLVSPSHTLFCSYCKLTLPNIGIFDKTVWPKRTLTEHRVQSEAWRAALTEEARERSTEVLGIRWSVLNLLPYWNPLRQLGVEAMHMFLRILSKQAREVWHMNINLDAGDGTYDPCHKCPDAMTMALAEHGLQTKGKTDFGTSIKIGALRELCHRRGIRTGGRSKRLLLSDIHQWVRDISGSTIDANQALEN